MLSNRTYRNVVLAVVFLLSTITPTWAMSYSTGMMGTAMPMSQTAQHCPMGGLMMLGITCHCQMTPVSEPLASANLSIPVSVMGAAIASNVLFNQSPECPTYTHSSGDPPVKYSTVPIFLSICSFLN